MSNCKVDSSALDRCQKGFNQFAKMLQDIHENNVKWQRDHKAAQQRQSHWDNVLHPPQKARLEQGKEAPAGYIWHGGRLVNCNTRSYVCCNCNDASMIDRKCKACGLKDTCICTAGLGYGCHKCEHNYLNNTVSAYLPTYNAWLRANPRPTLPAKPPAITINAGDFICAQCTQCQEFSQFEAQNIDISNINQAMQCVNKMSDKMREQAAEEKSKQEAEEQAAALEAKERAAAARRKREQAIAAEEAARRERIAARERRADEAAAAQRELARKELAMDDEQKKLIQYGIIGIAALVGLIVLMLIIKLFIGGRKQPAYVPMGMA